ncbi:hypothetical protein D8S78_10210 [Natrialba swarupiae]|nr:hypothetical protein [Natrialba swarupiae]
MSSHWESVDLYSDEVEYISYTSENGFSSIRPEFRYRTLRYLVDRVMVLLVPISRKSNGTVRTLFGLDND